MKTQSYNIVFVSDLNVIVSQMNVAVKKSEAVLTHEPFSKGVVFTADQNLSFTPEFQKFRRCSNGFYRSAKDKAVYMRKEFDITLALHFKQAAVMVYVRDIFVVF